MKPRRAVVGTSKKGSVNQINARKPVLHNNLHYQGLNVTVGADENRLKPMKALCLLAALGVLYHEVVACAQPTNPPSPIVADVLKLSRAKVDESVILAFVQTSSRTAPITAS